MPIKPMVDTSGHHIVYGTLTDYLTGEELPDTDDERYRQGLAKLLVEEKGYAVDELEPRLFIETTFNNQCVRSQIELTARLHGRRLMIVRYGPGSLVTRERAAIAAARILGPDYRIPWAIVTNCRDAELLDTHTGAVLAHGMTAIPDRMQAERMLGEAVFSPCPGSVKREREERILNVFDVEVCCMKGACAVHAKNDSGDDNRLDNKLNIEKKR